MTGQTHILPFTLHQKKTKNISPKKQIQRGQLEQEAYDEKNKLLNQSQFQELLDLQTDEEPDFVEEIVDMYITDAKDMLKELNVIFEEEKVAGGRGCLSFHSIIHTVRFKAPP